MEKDKIKIGYTEYEVLHNLSHLGYDFNKAWLGFLTKRKTLSVNNFCSYIKNSDPKFICIPC